MAHRPEIFRRLGGAATLLLLGACGGGPPAVEGGAPGVPAPRPPPPATMETAFILESSGVPPEDTSLTLAPAEGRVVILRRGAPDNSLFAEVAVPPAAEGSPPGQASLRITPRPGLYGLDLAGEVPPGSRVTFSYGVHFVAPAGARERYGSDLSFEEALWVARVEPDGRVVFLPTARPGSDLLSATIPGPGRYVVAAPRS